MDGWDWNANGDRDVLQRIVALLFALAGLAEMAAALPFLRRRKVLGILGRGEAAARIYFAATETDALSGEDTSRHDDAPADAPGECCDALLLAARFRALAFMLAALLTLAAPSEPRRAATRHTIGDESARQARGQSRSPAPDTS